MRNSKEVIIGGGSGWCGKYFKGVIDEVKIYGSVLSPEQIEVDYQAATIIWDLRPMTGDHNDSSSKMERNKSKTVGGIGLIGIGLWFLVLGFVRRVSDSREKIK